MTYLALWLLAVGVCDLLRARRDHVENRDVFLIAAASVSLLVALTLAAGPVGAKGWGLTAFSAAGLVLWVVASAAALNHQGVRGGDWDRRIALGALVVTVFGLLVTSGHGTFDGGVLGEWYAGLGIPGIGSVGLETFLLGCGLLVFQLSSANVVVRMVLDGVGTPASSAEDTLKGGRLLGPLERVFILGLGMAGHVTAASIVIAAKGLLRYPELQHQAGADAGTSRRGEVSEYFLVGSFVSWLIALVGLPLL